MADPSSVDDGFHTQSSKYEHLNDRKVTRDGRLASTSPKKEQPLGKTRFLDKFKKRKAPEILAEISHDQYALMGVDIMKGELRGTTTDNSPVFGSTNALTIIISNSKLCLREPNHAYQFADEA